MRRTLMTVALVAALLAACGDDDTTVPFTLHLSPEFVQGAIPGTPTGVLATIEDESAGGAPVTITATADGATVTVAPTEIVAGEVAEVTVVPDATAIERPIEIVVTATRGDLVVTERRTTTVMTWEDDRGDDADALLAVFVEWLAAERPELGIGPDTGFNGSLSAPGLLIVNHYLYLSDEWEVGLSWHIMIPPDDWADIYLRPRDEAAPTLGFRLSSQAAARDGVIEIAEVTPPAEVVR